ARANDNGGERRKAAQLVHDWLPYPCLISRLRGRQGSKLAEKNLPPGADRLIYGGPKADRMARRTPVSGPKRSPGRGGSDGRGSLAQEHSPRPGGRPVAAKKANARAFGRQSSTPEILGV